MLDQRILNARRVDSCGGNHVGEGPLGVEPELAADAQASLRAGKRVTFPAEQVLRTIADGLRTSPVGEIPFAHISKFAREVGTLDGEVRYDQVVATQFAPLWQT